MTLVLDLGDSFQLATVVKLIVSDKFILRTLKQRAHDLYNWDSTIGKEVVSVK